MKLDEAVARLDELLADAGNVNMNRPDGPQPSVRVRTGFDGPAIRAAVRDVALAVEHEAHKEPDSNNRTVRETLRAEIDRLFPTKEVPMSDKAPVEGTSGGKG